MSNNRSVVVRAGGTALAATANSVLQDSLSARGVRLYLTISAASGTTPTLDIKVQTRDAASDSWFDLTDAAFVQKTTTGADDLTIYPGITPSANESVSNHIGREWRVVYTIAGTNPSFTFSLGAVYLA